MEDGISAGERGGGRRGTGPWSDAEQSHFEEGIILHGWSNWSLLEALIPTRSNAQIKSHAQKFRKHRADECALLMRKHEELKREREKNAANAAAVAVATPRRKKATTRRGGGLSRSATRAKAPPPSSARGARRGSFAGPFKSPIKNFTEIPSAESPLDALVAEWASLSAGGLRPMSSRRYSAPSSGILSAVVPDLASPSPSRPASVLERDPQDDELAAMAAAVVTPSPSREAHIDHLLDDVSLDHDTLSLAKVEVEEGECKINIDNDMMVLAEDEKSIDELLQLEVDDVNLDMIADCLDQSWSALLPVEAVAANRASDLSSSSAPNSGRDDAGSIFAPSIASHDSAASFHFQASGQVFEEMVSEVHPDPCHFLSMRSLLVAPPDFNNPKEYLLGGDTHSRTAKDRGSLCRARIMDLLKVHLDKAWWREDASAGTGNADEVIPFKKFALERLVALTAAMLDVDHWHLPREALVSVITESAVSGNLMAMESQRFNDEDDVRHVGQLLSGLWERINRSLSRDGFALLGTMGNADSPEKRMERHVGIDKMVARLDAISRQHGGIELSPHVTMYAKV